MKSRETLPFTSRQSRTELILALLWLPVHLLLLPNLLVRFFPQLDAAALNVACYAIGAVYMLLTQFRFLRRDFEPLCDRFFAVFLQVLGCYGAMLLFNMALSGLLLGFLEELDNPNNAAVVSMARVSSGPVSAMAVFFAPILEEVMFRGAIFGALRHRGDRLHRACLCNFNVGFVLHVGPPFQKSRPYYSMDAHRQKYTILTRKISLFARSGAKCLNRAENVGFITMLRGSLRNFVGFSIDIFPQNRYS